MADNQIVARLTRGGTALAIIATFINEGNINAARRYILQHEDEVRQQILEFGGRSINRINQMLQYVRNEVRNAMGEGQLQERPAQRRRTEEPASLENSPATTQATMSGDDAPMGIEGAETQVGSPHDVWTRFPNHQWARLGWWYTNYISDVSTTVSDQRKNAFDDPNWESTTPFLGPASGGGARISPTGDDILGVDGLAPTIPSGHDFKNPMMFQLRMTSPYNILKTYTGAGIVGNGIGNSQPAWLEMFEGKYQFYHVNECDWRVDLNFGTPWTINQSSNYVTPNNVKDIGYYIFWKYTSNDVPPLSFPMGTNNYANGGVANAEGTKVINKNQLTVPASYTQPCTPDDYFRMKGFHSKHVSLSSTNPTHVTISGTYKFGQCKMDIKQQDHAPGTTVLQTEGWLATGSTYLFPEDLTIIIVQDNASMAQPGIRTPVGYRMNTEMLTEFRDLRSAFKFPTPANAFINDATTVNTEASFFNKGAAYT